MTINYSSELNFNLLDLKKKKMLQVLAPYEFG